MDLADLIDPNELTLVAPDGTRFAIRPHVIPDLIAALRGEVDEAKREYLIRILTSIDTSYARVETTPAAEHTN